MAKIYDFPQGKARRTLKKEAVSKQRKELARKTGDQLLKHLSIVWFYLRFLMAGALHFMSSLVLLFAGVLRKPLLLIGGLFSVITWLGEGDHFWSANHHIIIFVTSFLLLTIFAAPLHRQMNIKRPWHRLLTPDLSHGKKE